MAADADASELGRALAAQRWAPETRLRVAVETVIEQRAGLNEAQRAELEAAISDGENADA